MSGAKNDSARASAAIRGPSRQITKALVAGGLVRAATARARSEMTKPSAPSASRIEAVARSGACGHEFSNGKNPAGAGCGIYIEPAAADVSGPAATSGQRFNDLVGFADHFPQRIQRHFGFGRPFQSDEHR